MGDLVTFNGITTNEIPPDRVLEQAIGKLKGVVVIGHGADDDEYFATSYTDGAEVLWLVERLKKMLLEMPDE